MTVLPHRVADQPTPCSASSVDVIILVEPLLCGQNARVPRTTHSGPRPHRGRHASIPTETPIKAVLLTKKCIYPLASGCDCACTLVIHDNDAIRGDFAFRHLERHRDRALGKQPLSNAQRDRIVHQPERVDQIMLDKRLNQITTSPNVQIRPLLLFCLLYTSPSPRD